MNENSNIVRLRPLAYLSPRIVEAIANGTAPAAETGPRNRAKKRLNASSARKGDRIPASVALFCASGDTPEKTGMPGWDGRIRTLEPRDRGNGGDSRLIFIAERSGLPRRRERHCAMPR